MQGVSAQGKNVYGMVATVVALLVYCFTANPSVTFTDSGELAAVSTTLGVAHPTGYPLFTIIGHLWSKLPIPLTPVRKLNFFAAFCTAASVFLFYKILLALFELVGESSPRLNSKSAKKKPTQTAVGIFNAPFISAHRRCLIAFWTALAYAFARTVWDQASSIEVYSLHLVMLQTSVLLFLRAEQPRQFALWAFVLGLAFSNHMTMILTAPATIYLFFKRLGSPRQAFIWIAQLVLPFAAGLALYLYLPLRSQPAFPFAHLGIPDFDWGRVCRSVDKFLYHVGGGQYRVWMFNSGEWPKQLKTFFELYPYQVGIIGFVPLAVGLWKSYRSARSVFWFLLLLIVGCVLYAINYSIHDISSYFLLAFVASLWLVGIGIDALTAKWKPVVAVAALLPMAAFGLNFKVNNHSKDYLVLDYTRNLVDNLEPNAIIISAQWDFFCSAFWYLQRVEGYRSDVVLIEKELLRRTWYPLQLRRWYPDSIARSERELSLFEEDLQLFESGKRYDANRIQARFTTFLNSLIERNISTRPIYVTMDVLQTEPGVATSYGKLPQGLAVRLVKDRSALPKLKTTFDLERFIESRTGREDEMQRNIFKVVANSIDLAARYAAETGDPSQASRFRELSSRLR